MLIKSAIGNEPVCWHDEPVIERTAAAKVGELARLFPVVTVTGPRQSGKTTVCRAVFPQFRDLSLEAEDIREFAPADPRGFLQPLHGKAILDEVQRCPELLSDRQGEVDGDPRPGRFILTGSVNLALLAGVSQSFAGRTARFNLLLCTYAELRRFPAPPADLDAALWGAGYPAVYDGNLRPLE